MQGYDGPFKDVANMIVNERIGNKFKKGCSCGGCGTCNVCKPQNLCQPVPVTLPFTIDFDLACGTVSNPLYEVLGDCGATTTIEASVTSPPEGTTACITVLVIVRANGETVERVLPTPVEPDTTEIVSVITITNVRQIFVRCLTNGAADGGCTGSLNITSTYCAPGQSNAGGNTCC